MSQYVITVCNILQQIKYNYTSRNCHNKYSYDVFYSEYAQFILPKGHFSRKAHLLSGTAINASQLVMAIKNVCHAS